MKKILTIIAILTVLAGCSDPFSAPPKLSPQLPDGTGAVHITLNGSARTAMPVQFDVSRLYYVLTFTSNTNGEEIRKTVNRQSSFTVELPTDDWDLEITGFASASDAAEGENVLVNGSTNNILVAPSPNEIPTVNVVLTPNESNMTQTQTGRGVLLYDITLPAGASGTITAYSLDGEQKPFYTLNSTTSANSITLSASSYSGTREMVSGFYLISITARLNNKDRVWRELAQIYDNAITGLEHEFTAEDITNDTTAAIASFNFALPRGYYFPINNTNRTINVIVPPDADITALSPVINHSGVMIKPAQGEPMDFTEPVIYTVYAENGAQTSYTVTVTDTITSTELLNSYLQNPSDNIDAPVPVKVSINLANSSGGWSSLLSVLSSMNSYVALDLSGSTGMETFVPGTSNTGKDRIVSLILPVTTTATYNTSSYNYAAFRYFSSLKSITGVNVTTLGAYSFYGLTGLETANFPALTAIGNYAFYNCSGLNGVIPDSVTGIGNYAFSGCTGLTGVTIPDSVTSIGERAFYNCTGLTGVTIGNSVTTIGQFAFSGCTGLTGVTIPDSVTSIGDRAFNGCTGLTSVTIGNNVTSIGDDAFNGCNNITSVTIGSGLTSLSGFNFSSNLTSVTFSAGSQLQTISGFNGCTGLTGITIPNSVTSIGNYAFYGCTGLTTVTIPDSVTTIGDSAFRGCTELTGITIPNSVTSIGNYAFYGCTGLTSVTIGNNVTTIGNSAFSGCTGLTSVTIGNRVTSIGNSAFSGCTGLTTVTIPASVTSIGTSAFGNCANRTVTIQTNKITTAQNSNWGTFFSNNTALSVIFEASIGNYAFYNYTELTGLTIGNGVASIGNYAFSGCTKLTNVTIPASVTSIGDYAFNNTKLTSVTFSAGSQLQTISGFTGCTGLTTITIPDSVTSIGNSAFSGCTGLTGVTIPDSVTTIEGGAFSGCIGLTSITIPASVTAIGGSAFGSCTNLTVTIQTNMTTSQTSNWGTIFSSNTALVVIFGDGITSIGNYAFYNCTGLTTITIPDSVTGIAGSAFSGCTGLTRVTINGTIASLEFYSNSFPGDLRDKYFAAGGGKGTYTASGTGNSKVWTKVD